MRGAVAILFGVLVLLYPGMTLVTLVYLFGGYAIADGVFMIVSAIANRGQPRWGWLLAGGIAGIAAGVMTFIWPAITAAVLLAIIATWAILLGMAEIAVAIELRKVISGEWLLVLAGVIAVGFGVFLIARPQAGALAVAYWIGLFAITSGVLEISLGLRLRNWQRMHPPSYGAAA